MSAAASLPIGSLSCLSQARIFKCSRPCKTQNGYPWECVQQSFLSYFLTSFVSVPYCGMAYRQSLCVSYLCFLLLFIHSRLISGTLCVVRVYVCVCVCVFVCVCVGAVILQDYGRFCLQIQNYCACMCRLALFTKTLHIIMASHKWGPGWLRLHGCLVQLKLWKHFDGAPVSIWPNSRSFSTTGTKLFKGPVI